MARLDEAGTPLGDERKPVPFYGTGGYHDEGKLSERIMLAAEAYGVGSCIGWLRGQGRADAKKLLGIPQEHLVRTIISLGYPDEEARRARPKNANARKPLSELVHFERY